MNLEKFITQKMNNKILTDSQYDVELLGERLKRKAIMKKIVSTKALLEDCVKKFNKEIDQPVNWKDLQAFPLNQWVELFPGVFARKYYEDGETILFDTKMAPGTAFMWHEHLDCKEFTEVIIGELYDSLTGETFLENQTVFYPAGQRHTPINTGDIENRLRVTFIKVGQEN